MFEQDNDDNKIKQAKLKRELDFVPIDQITKETNKQAVINTVKCLENRLN